MARPRVIQEAGIIDRAQLPRAVGTALEKGDLISYESNACVLVDAAAEDATFVGYSINQHAANDLSPNEMVVGQKGLVEYDATSFAYIYGGGLLYTSENTLAVDSGANTIAWAAEDHSAAAVTRIVALINAPLLQKFYGVDA